MRDNKINEKPEVYALSQNDNGWQISRRDFLKAAGIGAAALGFGMSSYLVKPAFADESMEELCRGALSHAEPISELLLSPDGKYIISRDTDRKVKVWDFDSYALLGTSTGDKSGSSVLASGYINDRLSVLWTANDSGWTTAELPEMTESGKKTFTLKVNDPETITAVTAAANGDIFVAMKGRILRMIKNSKDEPFSENTEICKTEDEEYSQITPFANGRRLLLKRKSGAEVFDLQAGKMADIDLSSTAVYSILPGDARIISAENKGSKLRIVSLVDGSEIWSTAYGDISASSAVRIINGAAVTPDGSFLVLIADSQKIVLISLKDGSTKADWDAGSDVTLGNNIAMARDGSKLAVSVKNSIFFFALPDLSLIGCPVDLSEMKSDTEGIKVTSTNPVTGRTETITLPCGSPIPAGAVCTCNCVSGTVCPCVSHVVVPTAKPKSNPCSCQSVGGGHYWHPN